MMKSEQLLKACSIQYGSDVSAKNNDGLTPLHATASSGTNAAGSLLLEYGAAVSARTHQGQNPLLFAKPKERGNRRGLAQLLIENGAVVSAKTDDGRTPLHEAAGWGYKERKRWGG